MRRTTSPLRTFNSRVIILARASRLAPACSRGRSRADTQIFVRFREYSEPLETENSHHP